MSASSHRAWLASDFQSHWEAIALPWLARAAAEAWKRAEPAVVLVPSRPHVLFVQERLLRLGLSFFGLRVWTPPQCRRFLAERAALEWTQASRATREWLMAHAAAELAEENPAAAPIASGIARAPAGLVHACERLEAAGWSFADASPGSVPDALQRLWQDSLRAATLATPTQLDGELATWTAHAPPCIGSLLILGFDGAHWPQWRALQNAAAASAQVDVCLIAPRADGFEADALWVGSWEEKVGAAQSVATTQSSPIQTPSASLRDAAAAWESGESAAAPAPVEFFLAQDPAAEARVILAWITKTLVDAAFATSNPPDTPPLRIGVLFDGSGPLARAVADGLAQLELDHADHFGQSDPGIFDDNFGFHWLEWQRTGNPAQWLALAREQRVQKINDTAKPQLSLSEVDLHVRRAREAVLCEETQTVGAWLAAAGDASTRAIGEQMQSSVRLPVEGTFAQMLEAARASFEQWEWPAGRVWLDAHREEIAALTQLHSVGTRESFCNWLGALGRPLHRSRSAHGKAFYGAVHLLAYEQAKHHQWTHLICSGLHEGGWPRAGWGAGTESSSSAENASLEADEAFLSNVERAQLNSRLARLNRRATEQPGAQGEGHSTVQPGTALLLEPRHERALARAAWFGLVENTSGALALTASFTPEPYSAETRWPGELFSRAYGWTHGRALDADAIQALCDETARWLEATKISDPLEALAPAAISDSVNSLQHTQRAYQARRDSTAPFGPYDFALSSARHTTVHLSARNWDRLRTEPADVWFNRIIGASSRQSFETPVDWARVPRRWIRRWLARLAPLTAEDSALPSTPANFASRWPSLPAQSADWLARLESVAERDRARTHAAWRHSGQPVPRWWDALWEEARAGARSILAPLAEQITAATNPASRWASTVSAPLGSDTPETSSASDSNFGAPQSVTSDLVFYAPPSEPSNFGSLVLVQWKLTAPGAPHADSIWPLALQVDAWRRCKFEVTAALQVNHNGDIKPAPEALLPLDSHPATAEVRRKLSRGVLGMRGAVRPQHGPGADYPLATLPVDEAIIEARARRSGDAFEDAAEESEE